MRAFVFELNVILYPEIFIVIPFRLFGAIPLVPSQEVNNKHAPRTSPIRQILKMPFFVFIVSFAHLYPIEHRFLDNKIKFTALSALLRLPRLESDGSLSSHLRFIIGNTKRKMGVPIPFEAVGNAH